MRFRRPLLTGLFALAVFALAAGAPTPAVACCEPPGTCPCWEDLPRLDPIVCHDRPFPLATTFAFFTPPPLFVQVTPSWCRANGIFQWVDAVEAEACRVDILHACGIPHGGCD